MKFVKWGICVCTAFALAVTLGFSQAATGSISGTVVDSSGAAIPGAEITVTNQGTSQQFVAVSSAAGSFSVPALIPAFYEIKVSLAGFKTFVARDAKVDVGKTYSAVAILEVGGINEVVTVSSGADLVNTSEAQISNTVTREQILELPLDGRNVLNLITLQAGTANNGRTPTAISGPSDLVNRHHTGRRQHSGQFYSRERYHVRSEPSRGGPGIRVHDRHPESRCGVWLRIIQCQSGLAIGHERSARKSLLVSPQ